jgi:hypothetical protein
MVSPALGRVEKLPLLNAGGNRAERALDIYSYRIIVNTVSAAVRALS